MLLSLRLNSHKKMDSIWKEKYKGNDERSAFYFKAKYIGEEFENEVGNEVLVADDKERIGYVILFENGLEFNNMHDDDIEDYEDLITPVDDWHEYRQSCS